MILLARHGETDYNVPPARVQGRRDTPLNDRGRAQARELARAARGEHLRIVWSSNLSRARETAAIVADELGLERHHYFAILVPDFADDFRRE